MDSTRRTAWLFVLASGCDLAVAEASQPAPRAHMTTVDAAPPAPLDASVARTDDDDDDRWRRGASVVPLTPAIAPPAATGPDAVDDVIVWRAWRDGEDAPQSSASWWFVHRPGGRVQVVRLAVPLFAWGDTLRAWTVHPHREVRDDCDFDPDGDTLPRTRRTGNRMCEYDHLRVPSATDARSATVWSDVCEDGNAGDRTQSLALLGSIGPWVFFDVHAWTFACGGHGAWSIDEFVFDVRSSVVTGVRPTVFPTLAARAEAAAESDLRARLEDAGDPQEVLSGHPPIGSFDALGITWGPTGWSLVANVGAPTGYAFGRGRYSDWSDTDIPVREVPAVFAPFTVPPPEWRDDITYTAEGSPGGWSTLHTTFARRDALLRWARLQQWPAPVRTGASHDDDDDR